MAMSNPEKEQISDQERGWLSIMRLNAASQRIEIRKDWRLGRMEINFNWRSKNNLWGRFGGGWNWHIGIQGGGSCWMVFLLVCSLRFSWRKS